MEKNEITTLLENSGSYISPTACYVTGSDCGFSLTEVASIDNQFRYASTAAHDALAAAAAGAVAGAVGSMVTRALGWDN